MKDTVTNPNPFTKYALIKGVDGNEIIKSIEVYDLLGNLKEVHSDISSDQFRLDKANLATGSYLV